MPNRNFTLYDKQSVYTKLGALFVGNRNYDENFNSLCDFQIIIVIRHAMDKKMIYTTS